MGDDSQTTANLRREGECVLNLASSNPVGDGVKATAYHVRMVESHMEEKLVLSGAGRCHTPPWA